MMPNEGRASAGPRLVDGNGAEKASKTTEPRGRGEGASSRIKDISDASAPPAGGGLALWRGYMGNVLSSTSSNRFRGRARSRINK